MDFGGSSYVPIAFVRGVGASLVQFISKKRPLEPPFYKISLFFGLYTKTIRLLLYMLYVVVAGSNRFEPPTVTPSRPLMAHSKTEKKAFRFRASNR